MSFRGGNGAWEEQKMTRPTRERIGAIKQKISSPYFHDSEAKADYLDLLVQIDALEAENKQLQIDWKNLDVMNAAITTGKEQQVKYSSQLERERDRLKKRVSKLRETIKATPFFELDPGLKKLREALAADDEEGK